MKHKSIILSHEQVKALELAIKKYGENFILDNFTAGGLWSEQELKPLQTMSPSKTARALFTGYEVEQSKDMNSNEG